ncbi:site-specific integrase [Bradyrhizobium liaoningense]|uniref:tyrosine-type recombinase/integrase n=1 Tax=Bradyrhizobium liaoningense TaxID=43992 RepID=UPI001BA7C685|nr:site-specific integrase [Bradyrhizobium liaoningense]MBR1065237.1 tyrosine-type recombinase/integrase [Bradyrhizobium liaoningense]
MARTINRLSHRKVETLKEPGMYSDGGGLYLQVTQGSDRTPRKSWLFRYAVAGRERQMGLGPLSDVPLAEARDRASAAREMRRAGKDPIVEREASRAEARLAVAKSMSFDECATAYIAAHRAGWRNVKHASQWANTVATYCSPIFGNLPVQLVDVGLVMKAIEPVWSTKPETAGRVRGRVERILDWAKVRGYRDGENPARWRGHLDHLLPARGKVRRVKHHAALPYAQLPVFVAALKERDAVAARALEFAILTAARTNEVLGATWSEIDPDGRVWTIPAERMKAGIEHRVPLGDSAIQIIKGMMCTKQNSYVFYGDRRAALSNMSLLMLLRRMGRNDITTHGFRSTFRTWAAEQTSFPREVVESALAHTVSNKVEAAYQRGDMFDKRRVLMSQWAGHCNAFERATKTVTAFRLKP